MERSFATRREGGGQGVLEYYPPQDDRREKRSGRGIRNPDGIKKSKCLNRSTGGKGDPTKNEVLSLERGKRRPGMSGKITETRANLKKLVRVREK